MPTLPADVILIRSGTELAAPLVKNPKAPRVVDSWILAIAETEARAVPPTSARPETVLAVLLMLLISAPAKVKSQNVPEPTAVALVPDTLKLVTGALVPIPTRLLKYAEYVPSSETESNRLGLVVPMPTLPVELTTARTMLLVANSNAVLFAVPIPDA